LAVFVGNPGRVLHYFLGFIGKILRNHTCNKKYVYHSNAKSDNSIASCLKVSSLVKFRLINFNYRILTISMMGKTELLQGIKIGMEQFNVPDNLSPAEVGAIFDGSANNKHISAEIINLAIRGYFRVSRARKRGYEFTQLKPAIDLQNEWEKTLMHALFSNSAPVASEPVTYSSLRNNFSRGRIRPFKILQAIDLIRVMKMGVNRNLTNKGYLKFNPDTVGLLCMIVGIIILVVIFPSLTKFVDTLPYFNNLLIYPILVLITVVLIVITNHIKTPVLSQKGILTKEYIFDLKNYLQGREKKRLSFDNTPEKTPEQFEKSLPFAIALGLEREWAQQFKNITVPPPSWYWGYDSNYVNSLTLIDGLKYFRSSMVGEKLRKYE
jgi:hypothetical protein